MWKVAGKSRNGQLHDRYNRDKLSYKERIREEHNRETSCFSNDLHDALLCRSGKDLWKSWNSILKRKKVISHVGGIVDNTVITRNFVTSLRKILSAF